MTTTAVAIRDNGLASGVEIDYAAVLPSRLVSKVAVTDSCWLWQASRTHNGYPQYWHDGRMAYAHRVVYEIAVGPIAPGLDLDHLCHNADASCRGGNDCLHRRCVNPNHLEPATRRENLLRGETTTARHAAQTECLRGHAFSPENTARRKNGSRVCLTCRRASDQARAPRKRKATR